MFQVYYYVLKFIYGKLTVKVGNSVSTTLQAVIDKHERFSKNDVKNGLIRYDSISLSEKTIRYF